MEIDGGHRTRTLNANPYARTYINRHACSVNMCILEIHVFIVYLKNPPCCEWSTVQLFVVSFFCSRKKGSPSAMFRNV
jgi:hypothetical protein